MLKKSYNPPNMSVPSPVMESPKQLFTSQFLASEKKSTFSDKGATAIFTYNIKDSDPKIIAMSDFLPCYISEDKLNETGKFLQVKQEALLVSCVVSLKNILDFIAKEKEANVLNESSLEKDIKDLNKNLYDFCENHYRDVDDFIGRVQYMKDSFNFRLINNFSNLLQVNWNLKSLINFKNLLFITTDEDVNSATLTKLWIEFCLEYKEAILFGTGRDDSLFVNSPAPKKYNLDPFIINKRANVNNKISFNRSQMTIPPIFSLDYNLGEESNRTQLSNVLTKIFKGKEHSILNVKMLPDKSDDIAKRLAQISYLICRELKQSTSITSININEGFFNYFGYPPEDVKKTANNVKLLDSVIGLAGNDITEFDKTTTANNTLIGIAQKSFGQNQNDQEEVLTFESAYINDNISSVNQAKRTAILTPGSAYYIDNNINLNFLNLNSDATLKSLSTSLSVIKKYLLKDLIFVNSDGVLEASTQKMNFKNNFYPRELNIEDLFSTSQLEAATFDITNINPINLLRYIEKNVLVPTRLLERDGEYDDPPSLADGFNKDLSPLLISIALRDNNASESLLSSLFMYVINKSQPTPNSDATGPIKQKIIERFCSAATQQEQAEFAVAQEYFGVSKINLLIDDDNTQLSSLNKIAAIISNFNKQANISGGNPDTGAANPFLFENNVATKTFLSGVPKENIVLLLFYLCCLMIREIHTNVLLDIITDSNGTQLLRIKKIENVIIDKILIPNASYDKSKSSNPPTANVYNYDKIIIKSEQLIFNEIQSFDKMTLFFDTYLSTLLERVDNFTAWLDINRIKWSNIFDKLFTDSSVLTPELKNAALSLDQLKLLGHKLAYIKTRLSENYTSSLKNLVPYFVNFKQDPIVDKILPLEDIHIASFKLFLQHFLKRSALLQREVNNIKILSIGVPHNLYRKLSYLTTRRNYNFIYINVYMIDNLRPVLRHKPKKFIFDLNKFPIRVLSYYAQETLDVGDGTKSLPLFALRDQGLNSTIKNSFDAWTTDQLNQNLRDSLRKNHEYSFFIEEYLRFLSGCSFDENAFVNYNEEEKISLLNTKNIIAPANSPGAINYLKNTILTGEDNIKRAIMAPKKFDRTFHLMIDPDTFEIDKEATIDVIKGFLENPGTTYEEIFDNLCDHYNTVIAPVSGYDVPRKRIVQKNGAITFNEFYVDMEVVNNPEYLTDAEVLESGYTAAY